MIWLFCVHLSKFHRFLELYLEVSDIYLFSAVSSLKKCPAERGLRPMLPVVCTSSFTFKKMPR